MRFRPIRAACLQCGSGRAAVQHTLPLSPDGFIVGGEGWGDGDFAFALLRVSEQFRAPTGARATFLLRGQEKSNQKRRPPRLALAGRPARQVREAGPGLFERASCPCEKARPSWPSPPHRRPGAPRASAHRARQKQQPERLKGVALALGFAVASARRSALLHPGPLWRGGWAQESPQDGPHGCGPVFRRYRDVPSKNPVARPRTRSPWMGAGRAIGVAFLLGYFLLTPGILPFAHSGRLRRSYALLRVRGHSKRK